MYKIVDTMGAYATVSVPTRADIIDFVRPMFEQGESCEVDAALDMLELSLARELPTGDLETALGIRIL